MAAADLEGAADAEQRVEASQRKLTEAKETVLAEQTTSVSSDEVAAALKDFSPAWEQLTPKEQARVVRLLELRRRPAD